jgi:hypothetical protein
MSKAQKVGVGLFYAAIAASGAAYALLEHHQSNWLVRFMEQLISAVLILGLVFAVYGLFRTMASALRELDRVSQAAHANLHVGYGKK